MRVPLLFTVIIALLLGSCSEFSKAVKSTDVQYKYRTAVKYMEKPDYDRAMPLLEELRGLTGRPGVYSRWLHAVALGACGRYGDALEVLDDAAAVAAGASGTTVIP